MMLKKYEDDEEEEEDEEMIHMNDLENAAFLPLSNNPRAQSKYGKLWNGLGSIIHPIERLFKLIERFKLVVVVAIAFIVALALLALMNQKDNTLPQKLPKVSVELAHQLEKDLEGTVIPSYALTYAPIVVLDRHETFFPSDFLAHLQNTHPTHNFTSIPDSPSSLSLFNLDQLNSFKEGNVYLTSIESVISLPKWLRGFKPSKISLRTEKAKSCVVVVVEKEAVNGEVQKVVDVFYLYFYSFNSGPSALGRQVGNHVGDWEHNMIRFIDGIPTAIWYSQHGSGAAYTYEAVQKIGVRPVAFSARGSHSNWPEAMAHDFHNLYYRIPSHLAYDYTSLGRIWDPTLSALFYSYNTSDASSESAPTVANVTSSRISTGKFTPAKSSQPTSFLYFDGKWGDQKLRLEDEGQEEIHGFFKWVDGPTGIGWGDKAMVRNSICPEIPESAGQRGEGDSDKGEMKECVIRNSI